MTAANKTLHRTRRHAAGQRRLVKASVAASADFLALLARSRARYKAEGGISHADMKRRLGLSHRRAAASSKT